MSEMIWLLTVAGAMAAYAVYNPNPLAVLAIGIVSAMLVGAWKMSVHVTEGLRAPRWQAAIVFAGIILFVAIIGFLSPSEEYGVLYRGM